MEIYQNMTFDEMQLILQQVVISQRDLQVSQRESQEELKEFKEEVRTIVRSNDRTIQAMLDQAATDRLKREEDHIYHETRMERLERISEALTNMLVSVDEDRPTILRKLNKIEQNQSTILDRLPSE
jgi:vacuolar-type H+-ATPase subunit E/Vma4